MYAGLATRDLFANIILQSIPALAPLITYSPFSSVLYLTPLTSISTFCTGLSKDVTWPESIISFEKSCVISLSKKSTVNGGKL